MRKVLSLVASLLVLSVVVAAQHVNMKEHKVNTEMRLASDVYFGPHLVRAGRYQVVCDRDMIVFKNSETGQNVLKVKCQGKELAEPSTDTQVHVRVLPSGDRVVDRLLLKGSTVEHVF